jgi:hypothetical protein
MKNEKMDNRNRLALNRSKIPMNLCTDFLTAFGQTYEQGIELKIQTFIGICYL